MVRSPCMTMVLASAKELLIFYCQPVNLLSFMKLSIIGNNLSLAAFFYGWSHAMKQISHWRVELWRLLLFAVFTLWIGKRFPYNILLWTPIKPSLTQTKFTSEASWHLISFARHGLRWANAESTQTVIQDSCVHSSQLRLPKIHRPSKRSANKPRRNTFPECFIGSRRSSLPTIQCARATSACTRKW